MSSVLTKILINSLQFNLLAASFDYEWPAYLKVILEAQGAAGGVITNLLSTDCLNESNIRPIYINSIMLAFEPFLTPLLALVTVGIVAFVIKRNNEEDGKDEEKAATKAMARRFSVQMRSGKTSVELENLPGSVERALAKADMKFTKRASLEMDILSNEKADKKGSLETQALASTKSGHILPSSIRPDEPEVIALMKELESRRWRSQFYTALLSLNFTAYTAIVLQTFRLFNCDQIGSTSDSVVLLADMNQKCYEGQHLLFMICLGVPMLVLYVLGFPFVCMVFLWRNRKDMPVVLADAPGIGWEERFRRLRKSIKVFLLFHGFKPKYYFWEILIMARKIMIVCFAVFFDSPSLQAASSTLLIVIALGMQLQWKPFSTRMCNHFELYGIITSLVTFFFGQFLYFRINHAFKVFCSVIIVIVNIWFFCFMATRIIQMKIMEYHIRKEKKESQPVFEAMLVDKRDIDPEANGDDKKGRKGGHKRIDSFVPDPISRSASRIRRPNLTRVSSASDLRSVAMWSIYQKRESKRNLHLNSENEASRTEPYQSPARSPVGVSNTSPTESDLLERDRLSLPSGGVASETSRSRVASCRSKKSISRANSPPPGDDKRLRKATSCRELSTSQKARHEKRGRARSASPEGKESPTGEPFLQPKRDSGPPPVEMQNECVSPNGQVTSPQAAESSMVYVSVI
uniref:TRP C-terminal domain-containing protein n=2 Tax=Amorphochlora amoebiformis TaxID=1561963 RepID=A0A7S0DJ70_9EUKA